MKHLKLITAITPFFLLSASAWAVSVSTPDEDFEKCSTPKDPRCGNLGSRTGSRFILSGTFDFIVKNKTDIDFDQLFERYRKDVNLGMSYQETSANATQTQGHVKGLFPCSIERFFKWGKDIEEQIESGQRIYKVAPNGPQGEPLTSPEQLMFNISKRYIVDPSYMTFQRKTTLINPSQQGVSWMIKEELTDFNQIIDRATLTLAITQETYQRYEVRGTYEMVLNGDFAISRDIMDEIGINEDIEPVLNEGVTFAISNALTVPAFLAQFADEIISAMGDSASSYRCTTPQAGKTSFSISIPSFVKSYAERVERMLRQ